MGRRRFRPLNGILLLDKSLGVSSNKALQDARFLFAAEKAGHTGSLDPLATGMLPVCFGEATKVSAFLLDSSKRYVTTAVLGAISTTGDAEGDKLNYRPVPPLSDAELERLLDTFRGDISQIPPMHSALKKDGQPLYKLARKGVEVEREARKVSIYSLSVLERTENTLTLDVTCSKGTYIRSLVEDIGEAMGCGAYVSMLRREAVAPFEGQKMYTLDELKALAEQGMDVLDTVLLPMDAALAGLPSLVLDNEAVMRLRQGQRLSYPEQADCSLMKVYTDQREFIGLVYVQGGIVNVKRFLAY